MLLKPLNNFQTTTRYPLLWLLEARLINLNTYPHHSGKKNWNIFFLSIEWDEFYLRKYLSISINSKQTLLNSAICKYPLTTLIGNKNETRFKQNDLH